jgi:hypothetical protein
MDQAQRDTAAVIGYVESLSDAKRDEVQRCLKGLKVVLSCYPEDSGLLATALLGIEAATLIEQIGAFNDMVGVDGTVEPAA